MSERSRNEQVSESALVQLEKWASVNFRSAGEVVCLIDEIRELREWVDRKECDFDGEILELRSEVAQLCRESTSLRTVLEMAKCTINKALFPATFEKIDAVLKEDIERPWWCCRADYGKHEPSCKNYKE